MTLATRAPQGRGFSEWTLRCCLYAAALLMALVFGRVGAAELASSDFASSCLVPFGTSTHSPSVMRLVGLYRPADATDRYGPFGLAIGLAVLIPENAASLPNLPDTPDNTPARKLGFLVFKGATDIAAGRFSAAQDRLSKCLAASKAGGDRLAEAACENNLAVAQAIQGNFQEALGLLERSRVLYQALELAFTASPDRAPDSSIGEGYAKHRTEYLQFARLGRQMSALNAGTVSEWLGRTEQAHAAYQSALSEWNGPAQCQAAAADELVRILRKAGRKARADELEMAFKDSPNRGSNSGFGGFEFQGVQLGTAATDPSKRASGDSGGQPRLPLWAAYGEELGVGSEAALRAMFERADKEMLNGDLLHAKQHLAIAARRAAATHRSGLELQAAVSLMDLYASSRSRPAAIFYGKRAVELVQRVRQTLREDGLERSARRAYVRERQGSYRKLVSLLMDEQRLSEAEEVLQLLREDEGTEILGPSAAAVSALTLTNAESSASQSYAASVEAFRTVDRQRANVSDAALFGGKLLSEGRESTERGRLALSKSLPSALEAIRAYTPQKYATDMRRGASAIVDAEIALYGSRERLRAIFQHLLEDLPNFTSLLPTPEQQAQVQENLRVSAELPRLLCPHMGGPACEQAGASDPHPPPGGGSGSQAPNWNDTVLRALLDAEALEGIWRSDDARLRLERQVALEEDSLDSRLSGTPAFAKAARAPDSVAVLAARAKATALLYYSVNANGFDILLVTPQNRRSWQIALPQALLEEHIRRFQEILQSPQVDAREEAKVMYEILVQPVVSALEEAKIETLAVSPSGSMRYIPFAALYDGSRWLAERFSVGVYLGGPTMRALSAPAPDWTISAFGISALPTVSSELQGIVRTGGSNGVIVGRIAMDEAFTARALQEAASSDVRVVHMATHFMFEVGDPMRSALQLGDGTKLSLSELATEGYRFDRADLVTLSACQTGLSGDDQYGQEVDGLASLLMRQGAKSVLASLWLVEDESTAELMSRFYRRRVAAGMPRVRALQAAQLDLLRATDKAEASRRTRSPLPMDKFGRPLGPRSTLGRQHPYYWAAFVLMGSLL